jgi:hypothetical protein
MTSQNINTKQMLTRHNENWSSSIFGVLSRFYDHFQDLKKVYDIDAFYFRFGHTTIPPGIYKRDRTCNFKKVPNGGMALRLCSSWWDSQVKTVLYVTVGPKC